MNDEIIEILRKSDIDALSFGVVVNYITNLQQENKRLRNHIQMIPYLQTVREKDDYKSRCEKAIDKLTIKQARFINESDYVLDDNDLDEIMYILQNGGE